MPTQKAASCSVRLEQLTEGSVQLDDTLLKELPVSA